MFSPEYGNKTHIKHTQITHPHHHAGGHGVTTEHTKQSPSPPCSHKSTPTEVMTCSVRPRLGTAPLDTFLSTCFHDRVDVLNLHSSASLPPCVTQVMNRTHTSHESYSHHTNIVTEGTKRHYLPKRSNNNNTVRTEHVSPSLSPWSHRSCPTETMT